MGERVDGLMVGGVNGLLDECMVGWNMKRRRIRGLLEGYGRINGVSGY